MSKTKELPHGMTENMVKIMEVSMLAREKGLKSYGKGTAKLDTSGMVAKKPPQRLCKRCGKPLERNTNGKRFCDECAYQNERERQAANYKRWRQEHPKIYVRCAGCGRMIAVDNKKFKFCDECRERRLKESRAAYYKRKTAKKRGTA